MEELRALGWRALRDEKNCGTTTLQELSKLVGGWPDAPRAYTARPESGGTVKGADRKRSRGRGMDWAGLANVTMAAINSDRSARQGGRGPVARQLRDASDSMLIEELRRRGIVPDADETT